VLSLLRLASVPFAAWLMAHGLEMAAFWLFVAAGLTDAVDGAIARLCDARTPLGAWLDPLADKALLVTTYVVLGARDILPLWLVVLVVLRDVLILAYAAVYMLAGAFTASPILVSKINTAVQVALAALVLARAAYGWGGETLVDAFVYAAAGTTVASGAAYLVGVSRAIPARDG
jgi:cardiolipin synthase